MWIVAEVPVFIRVLGFDIGVVGRVNSRFSLLSEMMETNYAEENLSTEQSPPGEEARVSCENGDEERPGSDQTPPSQRTQEINGSPLLDRADLRLPKTDRLRKRAEFLRVYDKGKRFEGRFMTVFILPPVEDADPAKAAVHRLGVTATKKAIGNAVARNRAKRLLLEAFRLSRAELDQVETKYDWVLNARRSLLRVKIDEPLTEFRKIAAKIKGGNPSGSEGVGRE